MFSVRGKGSFLLWFFQLMARLQTPPPCLSVLLCKDSSCSAPEPPFPFRPPQIFSSAGRQRLNSSFSSVGPLPYRARFDLLRTLVHTAFCGSPFDASISLFDLFFLIIGTPVILPSYYLAAHLPRTATPPLSPSFRLLFRPAFLEFPPPPTGGVLFLLMRASFSPSPAAELRPPSPFADSGSPLAWIKIRSLPYFSSLSPESPFFAWSIA